MGYRSQFERNDENSPDTLLPILSLLLILIPLLVANLGFNHLRTLAVQVPALSAGTSPSTAPGKRILYLTLTRARFQSEWVDESTGDVITRSSFRPSMGPLLKLRKQAQEANVGGILISAAPYLPYQALISALEPFQDLPEVPVVLLPGGKR